MLKKLDFKNSDIDKVIKNIAWLFFDKFLRMGLGVFVVIMLARYLGPEQFGLFNYTMALITLFGVLASLGLNFIIIRDLVIREEKGVLIGTAFILRILGALLFYILLIIAIYILRAEDILAKSLTVIMGLSLLFNASEIIKVWFESEVLSKYTVIVENSSFIVFVIVKLILIYQKATLVSFAYAFSIEAMLVCLGLYIAYIYTGEKDKKLRFKFKEAKYLLKESWPLIISSAAWVIYTKVDQVMIGQLLDDSQVGLYSAASRLSDVANFFPIMIIASALPIILKLRNDDEKKYVKRFQQLYYFVITAVLLGCIIVTFASDYIISFLYGKQYLAASSVLEIHFWIIIFTTLSAISGRYMINDGCQKVTMNRHLIGVVLNIPLNLIAIPMYGIQGAAVASLISLLITSYLFDLFSSYTKHIFIQKTKALSLFWVYELVFLHKNIKDVG